MWSVHDKAQQPHMASSMTLTFYMFGSEGLCYIVWQIVFSYNALSKMKIILHAVLSIITEKMITKAPGILMRSLFAFTCSLSGMILNGRKPASLAWMNSIGYTLMLLCGLVYLTADNTVLRGLKFSSFKWLHLFVNPASKIRFKNILRTFTLSYENVLNALWTFQTGSL